MRPHPGSWIVPQKTSKIIKYAFMKTLKLIFKAVVVSILSLAPTAWAQIVATNSVTSGIIYVVDTDVGTYGTTTYDCQANVTATVSPYISSSGGDVYLLSATLTANNWVGAVSGQQDAGQGVLLFGQNGTIGSTSNPFHGSAITVTSPDYWYSGTYQAIVDDYNSESPITFNFGVSGGPFSLSISPNNNSSIMLNGPSSGLNGQIFMEDTATAPLGHTRYSGVFINGENISLQQFYLAEGQGGGEIGHITLTFPLTGGHTYWYGSPVLDSLTTGPTVTVPLSYVRGDYIPQPTAGISAKNYSINIGGQSTLIVTVTNRSQAVSLASGQVVLDTSSLGGLSVVGASSQSLGVIATNSSKNYTFTIQGASVGSFSPQISINNGQWGWPAGGKDSFSPLVASLPSSIVVILPAPTISAATSISSSGFTANWNSVSGATGYRLDVSTSSSFSSYVSAVTRIWTQATLRVRM